MISASEACQIMKINQNKNIQQTVQRPLKSAQHIEKVKQWIELQKTHSPMAAGSSESLLWLTFKTVSRGKFLRSSFNLSIWLWAKISFCKSTAYKQPNKIWNIIEQAKEQKNENEIQIKIKYLPPLFALSSCICTLVYLIGHIPKKNEKFRNHKQSIVCMIPTQTKYKVKK